MLNYQNSLETVSAEEMCRLVNFPFSEKSYMEINM
jgi:hypothetical protein